MPAIQGGRCSRQRKEAPYVGSRGTGACLGDVFLFRDAHSQLYAQSLAARAAADLANQHPDYLVLAGRLEVSNIHRVVPKSFQETMLGIESGQSRVHVMMLTAY